MIKFVEDDAATIAAENIVALQQEMGRALATGDPVRVLSLGFSYLQAVVSAAVNFSANQSFIDYAAGVALDAHGANCGVTRRPAEAARTTLRFSIAAAREDVVLIPRGTRATAPASALYFAAIDDVEIPAGDTYVDVIAEATVLGPTANGMLVGEISELVDQPQWVTGVVNQTPSADGSEAEDDESLRQRIREAPASYSVAGPEDAYKAQARAARADIDDVAVNSPEPRVIDVYFTLTGGVLPAPETIAEVLAYLNGEYRRPMSDLVQVQAPTPVEYTVDISYEIGSADEARAAEIQAAVTAAVTSYISWQRAKIGRDVNPSELHRRVMNAGALNCVVTAPVDAELDYSELAVINGDPTINFGGIVDE